MGKVGIDGGAMSNSELTHIYLYGERERMPFLDILKDVIDNATFARPYNMSGAPKFIAYRTNWTRIELNDDGELVITSISEKEIFANEEPDLMAAVRTVSKRTGK